MHYAELNQAWADLTAPGAAFEVEEIEVRGARLRSFKNVPPSVRALWLSTAAFDRPRHASGLRHAERTDHRAQACAENSSTSSSQRLADASAIGSSAMPRRRQAHQSGEQMRSTLGPASAWASPWSAW